MDRITLAWVDAQIEEELSRGCNASAVRDLAALVTVRDYLNGGQYAMRPLEAMGMMLPFAMGQGMRDHNEIAIGEYKDQRGAEDSMRQYGRRYAPDAAQMHPDDGRQHDGQIDHSDGHHLTRDEAERWVAGMHGEDGSVGGRWKLAEIKQYAGNFGIQGEEEIVEFFAVMNALYTDYCKVAKKYGVDKVDFWADLAKAFMDDKDAMPGKVKTYYECIAMKGDE